MEKKKRFFSVPMYVGIILCAASLAGCSLDLPERAAVSEGMGRVVVNIGGAANGSARTIAPDEGAITKYTLAFSGSEAVDPLDTSDDGIVVELEPGPWSISVVGYTGADGELTPVAEGSADLTVSPGDNEVSILLGPKTTDAGTGTFSYAVTVPPGAGGSLVITTAEGEAVDGGVIALEPGTTNAGEKALAPGEYLVQVRLEQDGEYTGFTEVLHIYTGLESVMPEQTYTGDDFGGLCLVTNTNNSGPGSLRQAINDRNALPESIYAIRIMLPPESVIALESALPEITRSTTIEGNGVTLTRSASWTAVSNTSQLLRITGNAAQVAIRRMRFKDGRATTDGGAIYNTGILTLESCIFSGNQVEGVGGAISSHNNLIIRGCTFFGNYAIEVGAVYSHTLGKTLILTGNLFYGNTCDRYYPVVYYHYPVAQFGDSPAPANDGATAPTTSYNVVDIAFGRDSRTAGWEAGTGDKKINALPVSGKSFRLLHGSEAAGRLPATLPEGYPETDFYGNPVSGGGAAGAVQESTAQGSGYWYFDLSVSNSQSGSVTVNPAPDADGLVPAGPLTIEATAKPGSAFLRWLVNGVETTSAPAHISAHTTVRAIFTQAVTVTKFTDGVGSAATPGTLRYALTNAQDWDVISFIGVTAGTTTIKLERALPEITKNLILEGNGVTLTRAASWTSSSESQLLRIMDRFKEVTIRRMHFKDGLSAEFGGAIRTLAALTLESCIFSGNRAISRDGGAIYSQDNPLTIRGCTFYGNSAGLNGGAVYFEEPEGLTLTGNLFYGGYTTPRYYPVVNVARISTVASYNAVDTAFGLGLYQCGWTAGTGDATFTALGISGDPVDTTTFAPVSGLSGILPSSGPADFPATDFYGETRTFPGAPGAVK